MVDSGLLPADMLTLFLRGYRDVNATVPRCRPTVCCVHPASGGHVPHVDEVVSLFSVSKRAGLTAVAGVAALTVAACGSSGSPSKSSGGSGGGAVPQLSASSFDKTFA